jgi:hypothetical protein
MALCILENMIQQLPLIAAQRKGNVKRLKIRLLDVARTFGVLELKSGQVYIETTIIDEDGIELRELLFSKDKKVFTLLQRQRAGEHHHSMRFYLRDNDLPVGSQISLGEIKYAI